MNRSGTWKHCSIHTSKIASSVYSGCDHTRSRDVLGCLLDRCRLTDCVKHIILLPLRELTVPARAQIQTRNNKFVGFWTFRNKYHACVLQNHYILNFIAKKFFITLLKRAFVIINQRFHYFSAGLACLNSPARVGLFRWLILNFFLI